MKDFFIRFCRWALALTGLSSAFYGCGRVEYGAPYSEYEVKGSVIDAETRLPVKGVAVVLNDVYTVDGEQKVVPYAVDSTVVADDGTFFMKGERYSGDNGIIMVKVTDIDPLSDGNYADMSRLVELEKIADPPKNSNWNSGTFGAEVTLEVEKAASGEVDGQKEEE